MSDPIIGTDFYRAIGLYAFTLLSVWGVMLVTMIWRYSQGKIVPVSKWITAAFVLCCLAAIYIKFKSFWGVEAGIALLSTCLFAKCLKVKY